MHRPAPSDVDVHIGRAAHESPEVAAAAERLKEPLAEGEMDRAATLLPDLREAVRRAELTPPARRSAERGLVDIGDGLGGDAYWRQRTTRKIAVILAGPATNFAVAIILFTVVLMQGTHQIGVRLAAADDGSATTRLAEVMEDSPAEAAGLRPGDRIVAVGGTPVGAAALLDRIQRSDGRELELTVQRGGQTVTTELSAREVEGRSLGEATARAFEISGIVGRSVLEFFPNLVRGQDREEVSSVVGITDASAQAFDRGTEDFLFIVGLISLSLAYLNLLPLLPLDGGHIAFSIVEGVRRRAIGREVYERVSIVGIALVLFLFMIGLTNDVSRISS
jgi:regulator of sigma E protease